MNDSRLNITIPSALLNQLRDEAEKKSISVASLVRIICSDFFNDRKDSKK